MTNLQDNPKHNLNQMMALLQDEKQQDCVDILLVLGQDQQELSLLAAAQLIVGGWGGVVRDALAQGLDIQVLTPKKPHHLLIAVVQEARTEQKDIGLHVQTAMDLGASLELPGKFIFMNHSGPTRDMKQRSAREAAKQVLLNDYAIIENLEKSRSDHAVLTKEVEAENSENRHNHKM